VAKDYEKAFHWYEESAAQGYAYGQYSAGWFYDKGLGVQQDFGEAVKSNLIIHRLWRW
jgi:TPR repeat protein